MKIRVDYQYQCTTTWVGGRGIFTLEETMLKDIDNEQDEFIEIDPYNLDSTTIRYLDLDELSKAELIKCIEVLLDEIGSLDFKLDNFHEFYSE